MDQARKRQRRQPRKQPDVTHAGSDKPRIVRHRSAEQSTPVQPNSNDSLSKDIAASNGDVQKAPLIRPDAQLFANLSGRIDSRLLKALEAMHFVHLTPVQQLVISQLPSYRSDCLVRAKTGTGKTVAFFLPALHSLLNSPPLPRGQVGILVISPTRELALQIAKECDQLTSQMSRPLECHTAFGGMLTDCARWSTC